MYAVCIYTEPNFPSFDWLTYHHILLAISIRVRYWLETYVCIETNHLIVVQETSLINSIYNIPFIDLLSLKYSLYIDKNVFWIQWWVSWQSFRVYSKEYPVWSVNNTGYQEYTGAIKDMRMGIAWYKIHFNDLLSSLNTFGNHLSVRK